MRADLTTPAQLGGRVPPLVTSRVEQLAALMSATHVSISAWVLTTLAPQLPPQQLLTPDCTQMPISFEGNTWHAPPSRLQAA